MKIKDLATLSGSERIRLALGLDKEQANKIKLIAKSMTEVNPHIKNLRVGKSKPGVSFFDFKNNQVGIGHKSPDVLAHELGHAISLANSSKFYKSLLKSTKKLTNFSNAASFPLAGFAALSPTMSKDKKMRLLNYATIASTAVTMPNLFEELKATALAAKHSPNKITTGISLLPGLISHLSHDLTAPATYLLTKQLLGASTND